MNIKLGVNSFSNHCNNIRSNTQRNRYISQNYQTDTFSRPSFGSDVNKKQTLPHITEKDINFAVTCAGMGNIKGNTREIYDYRCCMEACYGYDWSRNFKNPHIIRNMNMDEKVNGETTALVIPLNPDTKDLRGADNMTMVLNGNVPKPILDELIVYMGKVGILNANPNGIIRYYVNSDNPKQFMANPKIKTAIAHFFKQKELEQADSVNNAQEINDKKRGYNLKVSDINVVNIDRKQDKNNRREVKDYLREFLKNDKKMTVVYDKFNENNQEKDMTVILIPSTKSQWDCITVTLDKKIPQQECKDLLNHLVRNKCANVENEDFRTAIVDYLNNIS